MPVVEEGFSSLPLSATAWDAFEIGAVEASVPGGVLHLAVDIPDAASPAAYWGATAVADVPAVGSFGLEVHEIPEPTDPAEIAIGIEDDARYLFLDVYDGDVAAYIREGDDTFTLLAGVAFDPIAHRFIRVRWLADAATVDFETSPDGVTWTNLAQLDAAGFDFGTARASFSGGAWAGPLQKDPLVAFDNVFLCDLE